MRKQTLIYAPIFRTPRPRYPTNNGELTVTQCNNGDGETIEHLFFDRPFAKECWGTLNFIWERSLPIMDRLVQAASTQNIPFFTEVALIAAWELWKMRNGNVF